MKIVICPVSALDEAIAAHGASRVVTLLSSELMIETPRGIQPHRHLRLFMNDVDEAIEGFDAPNIAHVRRLIDFVERWERDRAMVIHCWAGISRSTAAAFTALCHLNPQADEREIALSLRQASAHASPNRLIVRLTDEFLGRSGRMRDAVEAIGRGEPTWENRLFALPAFVSGKEPVEND